MSDFLLVSTEVPALVDVDRSRAAWGFARGLLSRQHRVTILTCAPGPAAARIPGLARRLRTLSATLAGRTREMVLYEGRFALTDPQLFVVDLDDTDEEARTAWLGAAAAALAGSGLLKPDVAVGWGESSVAALSIIPAAAKFFVLPEGRIETPVGHRLSPELRAALVDSGAEAETTLAACGANVAQVVVVPSPAAVRALADHPALAGRASDEPIVAVPFGSDEPPCDPASDPDLAATFSLAALGGKQKCRLAMARKLGLALGPRTLLLTVEPLARKPGAGGLVVEAIAQALARDVAVLVPAQGAPELIERVRVMAIENPTKVALLDAGGTATTAGDRNERQRLAAADAILLTDASDLTGRSAGRALRYGALPITFAGSGAAAADLFVDVDGASRTGCAVMYAAVDGASIDTAITRAIALKQNSDAAAWEDIVRSALQAAPAWTRAAELLELFAAQAAAISVTEAAR